jgi:hypothetical protein
MGVRYTPAPEPFLTEQMTGGAMNALLGEMADRVVTTAQALAPVDRGDYRDSIRREIHVEDIGGGPRSVATIHAGTMDGNAEEGVFIEAIYVEAKYGVMINALGAI